MSEEKETIPVAEVATATIPVAAPRDMAMIDQEKQGAKCCFCCCDYRRAVVAISVLFIIYDIIIIILAATGSAAAIIVGNLDDDTIEQQDKDDILTVGGLGIATIVIYVIFFFCHIFSLCAALRYSVCMLSTMVIVVLIQFGYNIWTFWATRNTAFQATNNNADDSNMSTFITSVVFSVICYGLYLYPIIGLITEIKSGVMSQETYSREAYSCCCNPKNKFNH